MELFQHQKTGIEFLKEKERAILADEMGLGKTLQAIKTVEDSRQTLVVCPASLKINWTREIQMAIPGAEIEIINGRKDNGENHDADWIIINYDVVSYQKEWIIEKVKAGQIKNIILDEAHYIKGKSIRAKATLEVTEYAEKVYCLTGTPLMNRPVELWNLLEAIKHPLTQMKGARSEFSRRYCGGFLRVLIRRHAAPLRFWDESGATNLKELREHLQGYMLRRKKSKVLDLPAKIIDVQEVELTREQRKEYENAWDVYIDYLQTNPGDKNLDNIEMARHLVEIGKLKQVCSRSKTDRIISDSLNAIEQGEKIIIFSQYVETIARLADGFKAKKIKTVQLTGATKQDARQKAMDDFQEDENVKVFIANIKAGGVGINLTKASIVMFADMDWTPEVHSQAEDRAHRIGQAGTVNVYYYVVEDTIELDIVELLAKKKQMVAEVIDGTKNRVSNKSLLPDFIQRMSERAIQVD